MTGTPVVYPGERGRDRRPRLRRRLGRSALAHRHVVRADGWHSGASAWPGTRTSTPPCADSARSSSCRAVLSRDALGNAVIVLATGDQDTAHRAVDRQPRLVAHRDAEPDRRSEVEREPELAHPVRRRGARGHRADGGVQRRALLRHVLAVSRHGRGNVCAPNFGGGLGRRLRAARSSSRPGRPAPTTSRRQGLPMPAFTPTPGATPVFCQSTGTPDNTVIFGVSARGDAHVRHRRRDHQRPVLRHAQPRVRGEPVDVPAQVADGPGRGPRPAAGT